MLCAVAGSRLRVHLACAGCGSGGGGGGGGGGMVMVVYTDRLCVRHLQVLVYSGGYEKLPISMAGRPHAVRQTRKFSV